MLMPKKTKYRKMQKGRMKGTETRGTKFEFGSYALKALEPGWITARQIEAARRAMTREIKRGGNVWIKIFPDKIFEVMKEINKVVVDKRLGIFQLVVEKLRHS